MSELTTAVLAGDLGAQDIARQQGVVAVPELQQLLGNEDSWVRIVAVRSLGEIAQGPAIQALLAATLDEDGMVAGEAIEQLEEHPDQVSVKQLLAALERARNANARNLLSLFIGRQPILDEDLVKLAGLCQSERAEEAKVGCLAALARTGNPDAAAAFKRRVERSSGRERVDIIELLEYIAQRWVIDALSGMLDDRDEAIFRNMDSLPEQPQFLRVCDLAASAILRLTRTEDRVSFAADPPINHSTAQLDEVRRIARTVP